MEEIELEYSLKKNDRMIKPYPTHPEPERFFEGERKGLN